MATSELSSADTVLQRKPAAKESAAFRALTAPTVQGGPRGLKPHAPVKTTAQGTDKPRPFGAQEQGTMPIDILDEIQ